MKLLSHLLAFFSLFSLTFAAGPLDEIVVAKTSLALGGLQGAANIAAPQATLRGYGWSASSKENIAAVRGSGWAAMANTAMNYQLLINNKSVKTALATNLVVRIVGIVVSILNGDVAHYGTKKEGTYGWLAMNAIVLYGLVSSPSSSQITTEWPMKYGIKAIAATSFVTGVIMATRPMPGLRLLRNNSKNTAPVSTELSLLVEAHGAILAGGAAMIYAVATGRNVKQAIGYGFAPFTVALAKSVFVTRQYQKANMDVAPLVVWIVMATVIVGTLSF